MINNIIFDLGGVLYELDWAELNRNFERLQEPHAPGVLYSLRKQAEFFSLYETGNILSAEFREELRRHLGANTSDAELDVAWNSLLKQVIPGRAELVERLRSRFQIVLLSNINEIHHRKIEEECSELFSHFDRLFLSYQVALRKPSAEIFREVLSAMNWKPEETLFIDDSPQHIASAETLGIQTLWLEFPLALEDAVSALLANNLLTD